MNITEIISKSGDAELLEYEYFEGKLIFRLRLDELEKDISFQVKTNAMTFGISTLKNKDIALRTCRLELKDLELTLTSQNGYYTPGPRFENLMNETKNGYHLAYGKKVKDFKYILSIVGSTILMSCLLSNINDIEYDV